MFENPFDELYFGEVYRQVLQESWLPSGGVEWERVGKSRRGHRPTQRGVTSPNLTPAQVQVRRCFSKCSSLWLTLPWANPTDRPCDNRWGKEYWFKLKQDRGVPCSYYDLFMRYCLRHCIDTGCPMPSAYSLKISNDLSHVICNTFYPLQVSGNCGDVSLVTGPGSWLPPDGWHSPQCDTEGRLIFKDANGAYGCTDFSFLPAMWCGAFDWGSENPEVIDPDQSYNIYVENGQGPFKWSISGTGFSLQHSLTDSRGNMIIVAPGACGSCIVSVEDWCGSATKGYIRCSVGNWTECYGFGTGGTPHPCGPGHVEFISGIMKVWYDCDTTYGSVDPGCGDCEDKGYPGISFDFNVTSLCGGGECNKIKNCYLGVWVC